MDYNYHNEISQISTLFRKLKAYSSPANAKANVRGKGCVVFNLPLNQTKNENEK